MTRCVLTCKLRPFLDPGPLLRDCWCASAQAHSLKRLVRSTRRLADELNAEWLAIYVETPAHARLTDDQRTRISKNLILAEELGARSITLPGDSVPDIVLQYVCEHNVTKIIVGKPLRPRWREILFGSVVDQLVRTSGKIDVYIISGWYPLRSAVISFR